MSGHSRKVEIKPSLKGIARALNSSVVEEPLPDKLAALSERLTDAGHQDDSTSKRGIGRVQQTQPCAKRLESMIIADGNMTDMAGPSISSGSQLWEPRKRLLWMELQFVCVARMQKLTSPGRRLWGRG